MIYSQLISEDCPLIETIEDWEVYLSEPDNEEWMKEFSVLSRTGRSAGRESFMTLVELLLSRVLKPKQPGRDRNKKENVMYVRYN